MLWLFHRFSMFPHLYGIGIILRASNNTCGSVEACWGLEGNREVVRLWDVLHSGRAGVSLHDGWKLEGQHERQQLLEYNRKRKRWTTRHLEKNLHFSLHVCPLRNYIEGWNHAVMNWPLAYIRDGLVKLF